jgi:hypothetical protein
MLDVPWDIPIYRLSLNAINELNKKEENKSLDKLIYACAVVVEHSAWPQ